jgi:hypothetical protein
MAGRTARSSLLQVSPVLWQPHLQGERDSGGGEGDDGESDGERERVR